jgi:hypothetical protein
MQGSMLSKNLFQKLRSRSKSCNPPSSCHTVCRQANRYTEINELTEKTKPLDREVWGHEREERYSRTAEHKIILHYRTSVASALSPKKPKKITEQQTKAGSLIAIWLAKLPTVHIIFLLART